MTHRESVQSNRDSCQSEIGVRGRVHEHLDTFAYQSSRYKAEFTRGEYNKYLFFPPFFLFPLVIQLTRKTMRQLFQDFDSIRLVRTDLFGTIFFTIKIKRVSSFFSIWIHPSKLISYSEK